MSSPPSEKTPAVVDDAARAGDGGADLRSRPANRRSRWWAFAGAVTAAAFIALVVVSTESASVPVGASGAGSGMSMSMSAGRLALRMRDIDGRTVRLPGGRPGVVVLAIARGCGICIRSVRAAMTAAGRGGADVQLIVVMLDASTGRGDVAAFARSVGPAQARYVVDDRSNTIASTLGASGLGSTVVYDAQGRVVARPADSVALLSAALRQAGG